MTLNRLRNIFFFVIRKVLRDETVAKYEILLLSHAKFFGKYSTGNLDKYATGCNYTPKDVVYMADEIYAIGGLADRIRGIISLFGFCKEHNLEFGIYFTKPFRLEQYLSPNSYDWRVPNVCRCDNSTPLIIEEHSGDRKYSDDVKSEILKNFLLGTKKEIHCYSNICFESKKDGFHELFNTLFKPSSVLEFELNKHLFVLGEYYISISFRFVQLLGDFDDCIKITLPQEEQENLITKCVDAVRHIHKEYKSYKILVTSDSKKFCSIVGQLPFVYIVPGEIAHVYFSFADSSHMKTFVDFMLIARAKKAFLVRTEYMFKSGFARIAAKAGNVPFEEFLIR